MLTAAPDSGVVVRVPVLSLLIVGATPVVAKKVLGGKPGKVDSWGARIPTSLMWRRSFAACSRLLR